MKAKLLNLVIKLKCDEDLDEQDILDQFAGRHLHASEYQAGNPIEFIDAEIRETLSDAFHANIAAIVDDLNNVYSELLEDKRNNAEDKAFYRGALDILKAFKKKLTDPIESKQYCLDQIHGENVVQGMRLDKAEKLLAKIAAEISGYHNPERILILIGEIAAFLNDEFIVANCSDADVAELKRLMQNTSGVFKTAEVNYNPQSGTETARTALENINRRIKEIECKTGNKLVTCHQVQSIIAAELKKLEEK